MAIPASRANPNKVLNKLRNQTLEYYQGWTNAEKEKEKAEKVVEKKNNLYNRAIDSLVLNIKKKNELSGQIQNIQGSDDGIRTHYEGLMKVLEEKKGVELARVTNKYEENLKRLEVSFLQDKKKAVENIHALREAESKGYKVKISSLEKKVEDLNATHEKEKTSLISEYSEKIRELIERYETSISDKDQSKKEVIASLKEKHKSDLELAELSRQEAEKRHRIKLAEVQDGYVKMLSIQRGIHTSELVRELELEQDKHTKRYNRLLTYAYILTLYLFPQILWMLL